MSEKRKDSFAQNGTCEISGTHNEVKDNRNLDLKNNGHNI